MKDIIFDELLLCKEDLNKYFEENEVVKNLVIGKQKIIDNNLIVSDPITCDNNTLPFLNKIPVGEYDVVVSYEKDLATLAVKLEINKETASKYYMGIYNSNDVNQVKDGKSIGFVSDGGKACFVDSLTFKEYLDIQYKDDDCIALSDDIYFNDELRKKLGIGKIKLSNNDLFIFNSGYGDGFYSVYFGYDDNYNLCNVIIKFANLPKTLNYKDKVIDKYSLPSSSIKLSEEITGSNKELIIDRYINKGLMIDDNLDKGEVIFKNKDVFIKYSNKYKEFYAGEVILTNYIIHNSNVSDNAYGVKIGMNKEQVDYELNIREFEVMNRINNSITYFKNNIIIKIDFNNNYLVNEISVSLKHAFNDFDNNINIKKNSKKFDWKNYFYISLIVFIVSLLFTVLFRVLMDNKNSVYKVVNCTVVGVEKVDIIDATPVPDYDLKIKVSYNGNIYELLNDHNESYKYYEGANITAYLSDNKMYANEEGIKSNNIMSILYFVFLFITMALFPLVLIAFIYYKKGNNNKDKKIKKDVKMDNNISVTNDFFNKRDNLTIEISKLLNDFNILLNKENFEKVSFMLKIKDKISTKNCSITDIDTFVQRIKERDSIVGYELLIIWDKKMNYKIKY